MKFTISVSCINVEVASHSLTFDLASRLIEGAKVSDIDSVYWDEVLSIEQESFVFPELPSPKTIWESLNDVPFHLGALVTKDRVVSFKGLRRSLMVGDYITYITDRHDRLDVIIKPIGFSFHPIGGNAQHLAEYYTSMYNSKE